MSCFLVELWVYVSESLIHTYTNTFFYIYRCSYFFHTHISNHSWTTSRLQGLGALFSRSVFRIAWSKAVVPCPLSFFRGIPVCSVDVFLGEKNLHISGPMMQEVRNVWIFLILLGV